jgi:hypothetical protein
LAATLDDMKDKKGHDSDPPKRRSIVPTLRF